MNTAQAPTVSGYYWFLVPRSNPEIVLVDMNYTVRSKVVPFVLANVWRGKLVGCEGQWGEKIACPFTA